jgi:hypothetical protein
MKEIVDELDSYFQNNNKYPSDYLGFVNSKPIWDNWKRDSWGNKYKYSQIDFLNFTLISAGKDSEFNTKDDTIMVDD